MALVVGERTSGAQSGTLRTGTRDREVLLGDVLRRPERNSQMMKSHVKTTPNLGVPSRPPQNVDVLAFLDFKIPCFRLEIVLV